SPAIGVIMEGGRPVGVKVKRLGEVLEVRSEIIIAADGFESQVARWAGIRTVVPLKDVVSTAEFRMANVDIDPDFTEFYLGNEVAPGGYAWIFPKGEREANVGLGVEALRVEGGGTFAYLRKFVEMIPGLRKGQPLAIITGAVSVSLPLKKTYGNGIMLVGDAARLIDPLTGGGIANAMVSGMHAGRTAAEAIEEGNTTEEFLARYQERWKADLWRTLERNYYVKEKLRLMPDRLLSEVFEVLHGKKIEKVGVVPILEEIQAKRPDLVAELEKYL
ncbi:MAG: NAD(P)/FAD-dependent oxidoreductase, partial [Thermoplasmata archaeon]